jgi:hypothetical protein
MSARNLSHPPHNATPGVYRVNLSGGRRMSFHRLPIGSYQLILEAPTKTGSMVRFASIDMSAERAMETMMAFAQLCQQVDERGLPGND